jgi:arsenical pump membrane protein
MLTDMHLDGTFRKLSYLANVIGGDIGSLLLPMGTLASLLWFHIVSKRVKITWTDYMKVSFLVIPPSLIVSLVALYVWGSFTLG